MKERSSQDNIKRDRVDHDKNKHRESNHRENNHRENNYRAVKEEHTRNKPNTKREEKEPDENTVEGRNPVIEVLKAGRTIDKLFIAKGVIEGSLKLILSMAKDKGVVISEVDRKKLDDMSVTHSHQGVIAIVAPYEYSNIDEMLQTASERGEEPFVIILDEVEDPHNLGSIIRSANVLGAHGIIIPKRRAALVTATVIKASAGAVEYTKIAKVTNINQTIKELKDKGLWVIGTDMDGEICYNSNLKGPIAIVIGSEGKGISRLVKENCDGIVSIPVTGQVNSLNASVAAGVVMYEIIRQRAKTSK